MKASAVKYMSAAVVLGLVLYGCGGAAPDQALGTKPESPAPIQEQKSSAPAPTPADKASQVKPIPGYQAPDIIGRDVATGKPILLSSLKGQVVMVNFWATWCGPCRVEMPAMEELHKEGKVKILAVGADEREKSEQLAAFAQDLGLTFSIVYDGGAGMMEYRALGIPTSVFVDQNGIIRARHTGPMTLEQMRELAAETEKMGRQQ